MTHTFTVPRPSNMAAVSTFSCLYHLPLSKLGNKQSQGWSGRPNDEEGSAFEIVSDVPDVVLNILCSLPHLVLVMTL